MDTMANSIENAYLVLICVCEKYRLSENCQLEAKYAIKLGKPIIPLILQEGFDKCDGWLGFLISDKLFINFKSKRYNYEMCIQNLNKEIQKIMSFNESKINNLNNKSIEDKLVKLEVETKEKLIEKWSSVQVNEWLVQNKFHKAIVDSFRTLDGACLNQLFLMSIHNNQFLYQTLLNETNNQLKLADIILFITRLKQLFEEK